MIPKIVTVFIFISLICLHNEGIAQDNLRDKIITPGSEELQFHKLHPYSYTYELYVVTEGQQSHMGTLTDRMRILKKENVIERVQTLRRLNQPEHVDSVRASLNSLLPLSHFSLNNNREISLHFDLLEVEGSFNPSKSEAVELRQTFDHSYFDSNWVDLVIRLLPLQPGYQAILKTFEVDSDGTPGCVDYRFKVLKQVVIQRGNGKKEQVWVIHQMKQNNMTKFFLEKNSTEILRMEVPISDTRKMVLKRTQ